jgi:hypothetical protein
MNKLRPTVHTHIHTCMRQTGGIYKNTFLYSKGLKTFTYVTTSRSTSFTITVLPHIEYAYEKVKQQRGQFLHRRLILLCLFLTTATNTNLIRELRLRIRALTEDVGVVSGGPAGTPADIALLSSDLCAVLRPALELRSERPQSHYRSAISVGVPARPPKVIAVHARALLHGDSCSNLRRGL